MKKIFALLFVAGSLVACNNGGTGSNSGDSTGAAGMDTTGSTLNAAPATGDTTGMGAGSTTGDTTGTTGAAGTTGTTTDTTHAQH